KSIEDINGSVNLKLYTAEMAHFGELKNIKPFPFNNDGYSVGHATFSHNGQRIFFSSTHPNGFGGSDIYYSDFKDHEWADPINAGPVINTAGDELYPHLKNDSTLYFASNGHGGFGGLDIYLSNRKNGKFTNPHNLGHPVNSSYDDFSLVADSTGRIGFFTSNRPGGKGQDDIYLFVSLYTFIEGEVRERHRPERVIPGTYIEVRDEQGVLVDSMTSKADGSFHLDIPYDRNFTLRAEKDGYELLEDIGFTTKGLPFGIDSLMLPMWKHALYAKGRIFSNETQLLLPGTVVLLKDLTANTIDTLVVNDDGRYVFLVLPNHQFRIEAMKEGFITDGFNLNTKDLYDGELLNDIVLEEVYVEKAVILFDYNNRDIKTEWNKSLNHIIRTLRKYPKSTLSIGAHADARGTKQYNKQLSEKRAQAVVDYFIAQGISRNRIEATGFGEELILNLCSDGVECQEEDHSKNRRAEIKAQFTVIN
ncbi:MAG: OmpA family protein, partial [Flammeovirgaceae bacterium]|nr:OmpA family protein [Flammeovirgaceae bacterium]